MTKGTELLALKVMSKATPLKPTPQTPPATGDQAFKTMGAIFS